MKLGLVRHFKVDLNIYNGKLTPAQLSDIMQQYDVSPVLPKAHTVNSSDWQICYCSTLPRAIATAEKVFDGEIIKTGLLVEVPINPFTKRNISINAYNWHIAARTAWFFNHKSQPEGKNETIQRVKAFYKMILDSGYENILIVSHGFFIKVFVHYLMKMGFEGKIDTRPHNGKLYVFENNSIKTAGLLRNSP